MTVYLWHMPVLIALAGLSLILSLRLGVHLPPPLSSEWWLTRPLWLVGAAAVIVLVTLTVGRFERSGRRVAPSDLVARWRSTTAIDVVCAVAAIVVLLITGISLLWIPLALVLLAIALWGSATLWVGVTRRSVRVRA